jgi:ribA/ribD-fused uncharacterized protein
MKDILRFVNEHEYLGNYDKKHPFQAPPYGWGGPVLTWKSNEHYFHAPKGGTLSFAITVAQTPTPAEAKKRGRAVTLRPDWDAIKLDVMLTGLRHKFDQNEDICQKLVATGKCLLMEGNNHGDDYWGCVWNAVDRKWDGDNWLGRLLALVREERRTLCREPRTLTANTTTA